MQASISRQQVTFLLFTVVMVLIVIPLSHAQNDPLAHQSEMFRQAAKKATPAVVFVEVEKSVRASQNPQFSDPFDFFGDDFFERFFGQQPRRNQGPNGDQDRRQLQRGQGSGFVISTDGYILTNNHVVADADLITVKLSDERKLKAKVIGTDPPSDVAVIKVDAEDLPALSVGNSDVLQVGDWVIAVGSPFGLTQTVTAGIVSAKGRSQLNIGNIQFQDFIQTDAAINPGNSGGPLLNLKGEVVGINTAIASRSGGYMGIGFAIPINMAVAIKDQLLDKGSVTRGYLGLLPQDLTQDLAESFDIDTSEGVLVAQVEPDTPADKAGLKRGDAIVEFDGEQITGETQFRNLVALTTPGKKVSIVVIRDGKRKSLEATIGDRGELMPEASGAQEIQPEGEVLDDIGLGVQMLTDELADQLGYEEKEGVIVTQVEPGSSASRAGIRQGTLILEANRQKIKNVKTFVSALAESSETRKALLLVRLPRSPYAQFVVVRLD